MDVERLREKVKKIAKYLKYFYIFVFLMVVLKVVKMVFIGIHMASGKKAAIKGQDGIVTEVRPLYGDLLPLFFLGLVGTLVMLKLGCRGYKTMKMIGEGRVDKKLVKKSKRMMRMHVKSMVLILVIGMIAYLKMRSFSFQVGEQFVNDKYQQYLRIQNGEELKDVNFQELHHKHHQEHHPKPTDDDQQEDDEWEIFSYDDEEDQDYEDEDFEEEEEEFEEDDFPKKADMKKRRHHRRRQCPLKEVSFDKMTLQEAQTDLKYKIDNKMLRCAFCFFSFFILVGFLSSVALKKIVKLNKKIFKIQKHSNP